MKKLDSLPQSSHGRSSEIQEQSVERGKGGDEITFSLRGLAYRVKQNFSLKIDRLLVFKTIFVSHNLHFLWLGSQTQSFLRWRNRKSVANRHTKMIQGMGLRWLSPIRSQTSKAFGKWMNERLFCPIRTVPSFSPSRLTVAMSLRTGMGQTECTATCS